MGDLLVAPFAGAWIEIHQFRRRRCLCRSLPSRGRGLKSLNRAEQFAKALVAPFAGAWIEILSCRSTSLGSLVAPFAGAWIEISVSRRSGRQGPASLPSRGRGLKFKHANLETNAKSRSLRGGVD